MTEIADSGLPLSFTKGTKIKVAYRTILDESLAAVQAARGAGLQRLQIEFPLDAKDEGSTLVKRFETLVSFATQFGEALGLPRIQRVGENVVIRDNVNPAGGGEYLTNEGLVGFRISNADNTEEVLLVLVAGVDVECLNDLENLVKGEMAEPLGLDVPGTGQLSSLFTVGKVESMSVGGGATIILINSGIDKLLAAGQGLFGFGGASSFLKSFTPVYYIKAVSTGTGFLSKDFRDPAWKLWGVPRDATEAKLQVVRSLEKRPALWEAEQLVKQFCRA